MSDPAAPRATASAAQADGLLMSYERAGYARANPALLQPAEPFLDLSGEDIRKSLYLVADPGGEELCLRPDLTIPVARDYLASAGAGQAVGFCYLGPVFRFSGNGRNEFDQAGVEILRPPGSFRRRCRDAGAGIRSHVGVWIHRCRHSHRRCRTVRSLVEALNLQPSWKRRLVKDFNRRISLAQDLDRLTLSTTARRRI